MFLRGVYKFFQPVKLVLVQAHQSEDVKRDFVNRVFWEAENELQRSVRKQLIRLFFAHIHQPVC